MENPRHGREVYHASSPRKHSCAASNENEEKGDDTGNHGQRQQPTRDELPCGQSEQIEADLLTEDRIHSATGRACGVPIKRESRPFSHHAGPSHDGDEEGDHESEEVQDARNW